ncbi:hypothetical protein GN157_06280 [Flavobacterium rakeshii]|uniref:Uncharacterized protein n=1 Tax=Flavobacterium rakeshii TaxID=1038845 RepID=A0A6N8HBJ1_9FLAO|nr:hypothetical protein [Flavobacterium rakeshii]MUV03313.1 hypothetical protein [Flavobacterium rakeshii]
MEVLGYIFLIIIIVVVINNLSSNRQPIISNTSYDNTPISFKKTFPEGKYRLLLKYFMSIDVNPLFSKDLKEVSVSYIKPNWSVKYTLEEIESYLYIDWELSANSSVIENKTWQFNSYDDQTYIYKTVMKEAGDISLKRLTQVGMLNNYSNTDIYETHSKIEFEYLLKKVLTEILNEATVMISQKKNINELNELTIYLNKKLVTNVAKVFDLTTITPSLSISGIIADMDKEIQGKISLRVDKILRGV